MDLEVVGRHALFFDDDASASFVNSRDALVEWNSLFIDRYDVRHLLSGPLPPITRRRHLTRSSSSPPPQPDAALEFELDQERYLDLPSPSEEPEQDTGNDPEQADAGGYHTVGFSYGNPDEFTEQKNNDTEPVFQPAFPVPESLIQNLPPTEKLHQIIARTATFVSKHGGQSEIILRVKQGDNPTFGFLMPDHHLHAYFRFLVDHQELLEYDTDGKSLDEEKKADGGIDQTGGALSLLGSVYGSGEDEDGIIEDAPELGKLKSVEAVNAVSASVPHGSEQIESSGNIAGKNDIVSKSPCIPLKEKVNVIKHNRTVSTVKGGAISGTKKGSDAPGLVSTAANKSHAPAMPSTPKVELPILEPPPDQKKVVEKIVEFILKNGREFEAVLIEQNCKHGRFLFLMPSNQYHSYYLTVLQKAQESKLPGKGLVSEKHESVGHVVDKKTAKEGDTASSGSAGHDLPFDYDRKEKFKMVISKLKKDGHDPPSKASEPQSGVSLDTAAAILQAATRGIKNPGLEIFPKSSSGIGQGHSNEGVRDLSSGSLHASQLQTSVQKENFSGEPRIPVPVAKAIAETAALAAANEADSSEASLTREQKLKAERLKRAKMFAAMIKSGSAPLKSESLRGLSAEPPESGISSSGNEVVNLSAKEREGSSVPLEADISDKVEEFEKKNSVDDCNERRSKRSYRARSKRHEGEEESDNDLEQEAEEEEDKRGHKHSRKKRRSHHSSEHSRDRHKHRRHSSSKDGDSRRHRKHDSYDDEKHRHTRRRHKRNTSDDEHQPRKRNRHESSSDDEHRISQRRYKHSDSSDDEHQHYRRRHKHDNSSEDEHLHRSRSGKHRKPEPEKEADLEEGEIYTKVDQSKASEGDHANREAFVDFSKSHQIGRAPSHPSQATEVSDDLRAKIRAMLMATL
ncbi:PREDICTED: splicing factor suppressor of [Prunus dulcis]|uniref:PREDICTED: splicing factor suppressor of n=2 Tax=Prunus dulcis TaxID=3755 RepID=A0A5E4F8E2_PRUDU|nr:splicing factor, suppressor of white-apricot homolog [Prunus dulcis]KAI5333784.1 hypothetical protein L3X38_023916 [Prunus dulcis]VVA22831.1 PREDICTED: splicing factor suppressor of [Prunus dulcis]